MGVAIAMIPLAKGARLSPSKTLADLKETWSLEIDPESVKKESGTLSFGMGETFVAIALMPAPIPPTELEGPIETSVLWPDAAKDLAQSRGHFIVTVMSPLEDNPIELRKELTMVVASVLEGCEGSQGVYWGEATMLIRRDLFRDIAIESLPEPPLLLWVDFRVGAAEGGKAAGFTTGMEALGLMELESDAASEPPAQFRDRLMAIAGYLIENGLVIQNGHTVGEDENERIQVVYGRSSFGHENAVMRLEYEPRKKKAFWKRS
jgi:hypothetical protein